MLAFILVLILQSSKEGLAGFALGLKFAINVILA